MKERTRRQEIIDGWKQNNIATAIVTIIGAGALGNHVCTALVGLGIENIKIIDFDKIEENNLNRQTLFLEADIGKYKAAALEERIKERNNNINIISIIDKITEKNIEDIIGETDIIFDCVDRISVREIVNNYAIKKNITLIHGGISWNGWQAAILTRNTPCISCIYPKSLIEKEKTEETSCIKKEEASVVYIAQMCASFMVNLMRKYVLKLKHDTDEFLGIIFKYDEATMTLHTEILERKEECTCLEILKNKDKKIWEEEMKKITERKEKNKQKLAQFI